VIGLGVFGFLNTSLVGIILGSSGIVLMGFIDDKFGLSSLLRFILQFIFAGIVVFSGAEILEIALPFTDSTVELKIFSSVLSIVWIVFLTNVLNFLDGVSGLTSGVSFSAFLALVGLALLPDVHEIPQTVVIGIGSLMMFVSFIGLVLEVDSPKVLIGDSGTMFFGFMLAVLSMINGGKLATLALVLIVPILDGLGVIVMRIYNGRKPWDGDFNHLHHLLLRRGWTKRQIVFVYTLVSLVLAFVAIFFWNSIVKFFSLGFCVIGLVFVILYNHKKYADWKNFDKLDTR
jgi:UDP-GlcNAc:undecaprenyl-phosphate GlcNAc-1-phosphate transferase